MKAKIKKLLFGVEKKNRIHFGIAKGIIMCINPNEKSQRILGLDEYEIQKAFRKFSQKTDIFIDIGASDGYYGLIFRKYNPKGEIHMFEPEDHLRIEQAENFKLNNFNNYFQYNKYANNLNNENNCSIDNIFRIVDKCIFLKIDVEGAELEVLQGANQLFINNFCYVIIETHSLELEEKCIQILEKYGYVSEVIKNGFWRFLIPESRNICHNRWLATMKK